MWQHPKSKKWHCIDCVVIKKNCRRRCLDASVVHRAGCNSDHRLLRAKIIVGKKRYFRRIHSTSSVKRWEVSSLQVNNVGDKGDLTHKVKYLITVGELLRTEDDTIGGKWDTLRSALCKGAETELDYSSSRQPDWFRDSATTIKPLSEKRNRLYSLWLSTQQQ